MKLKRSFKWIGLALVLLGITLFSSCALILDTKAKLRIVNNSDDNVIGLYVCPSDSLDWGPNQLGDSVISPGNSFLLTDIPEGEYDIGVDGYSYDWCAYNNDLKGGNTYRMVLYNGEDNYTFAVEK